MAGKVSNILKDGILNKPCKNCYCDITLENCVIQNTSILSICKPCYLEKSRAKNKRRHALLGSREYRLSLYNLSIEKYTEMLTNQNGVCAICRGINKDGKPLYVDHNHDTNKVRALICFRCNIIIGHCKEDKELMMEIINYLLKYNKFESRVE